jgi:hypothetical protein
MKGAITMASDNSSDKNAQSAFGLSYLTEEKDWSGKNTTYRDVFGNVVGTSREENGSRVYRHTDGSRTWNGNDSDREK